MYGDQNISVFYIYITFSLGANSGLKCTTLDKGQKFKGLYWNQGSVHRQAVQKIRQRYKSAGQKLCPKITKTSQNTLGLPRQGKVGRVDTRYKDKTGNDGEDTQRLQYILKGRGDNETGETQ